MAQFGTDRHTYYRNKSFTFSLLSPNSYLDLYHYVQLSQQLFHASHPPYFYSHFHQLVISQSSFSSVGWEVVVVKDHLQICFHCFCSLLSHLSPPPSPSLSHQQTLFLYFPFISGVAYDCCHSRITSLGS